MYIYIYIKWAVPAKFPLSRLKHDCGSKQVRQHLSPTQVSATWLNQLRCHEAINPYHLPLGLPTIIPNQNHLRMYWIRLWGLPGRSCEAANPSSARTAIPQKYIQWPCFILKSYGFWKTMHLFMELMTHASAFTTTWKMGAKSPGRLLYTSHLGQKPQNPLAFTAKLP